MYTSVGPISSHSGGPVETCSVSHPLQLTGKYCLRRCTRHEGCLALVLKCKYARIQLPPRWRGLASNSSSRVSTLALSSARFE